MFPWFFAGLSSLLTAHAADHFVTSPADSGPGTLREALASANSGDIIYMSNSYEIALESSLTVDSPVTIYGNGTLRRGEASTINFAVFEVTAPDVKLQGFTIHGGNRDGGGGAIHVNTAGNFTAGFCTLTGNTSSNGGGGAVKIEGGATATMENLAIEGNTANGGNGGGIQLIGSSLKLLKSTLAENLAAGNGAGGGALAIDSSSSAQIINCTISENRCAGSGAGIHIAAGGAATLLCCTVTENGRLDQKGGGIWNRGSLTIGNSILSGNHGGDPSDCNGAVNSLGHNLAGNVSTGTFTSTGDVTGVWKPRLYPLDYYGGFQRTCPPVDGNTLVIDRGSLSFPGLQVTEDQRGKPRPVNGDNSVASGDESDIGAVEVQDQMPAATDTLFVNDNSDEDDGIAGVQQTSLREAIRAAKQRAGISRIVILYPGVTTLNRRLPAITQDLTIEAPGANVFGIEGYLPEQNRFFEVPSGVNFTLRGMKFSKADATTLSGNGAGGVIWNRGTLVVDRCEFTDNRSPYRGGAIYCSDGSSANIVNSTFAANTAAEGGAIAVDNATVEMTQCTFSRNSATSIIPGEGGGAVVLYSGQATMKGCTVVFNTTVNGGGLVRHGGIFSLSSNLIGNNEAPPDAGEDLQGEFLSLGFNLVTTPGPGSNFSAALGDIIGEAPAVATSLTTIPGTTRFHMPLSSSPAINKGISSGLPTDQRGRPRLINGAVDIGAVEFDPPQTGLVVVVNSHDDVDDGVAGKDHTSLREAIRVSDGNDRTVSIGSSDGHSAPPPFTVLLTRALPTIQRKVTISGSSARAVTLDAAGRTGVVPLLAIGSGARATISGITINNSRGSSGAAFHNMGQLELVNCQFVKNSARAQGGAIYQTNPATLTMRNCTLTANEAAEGGACYLQAGSAVFEQCTFQGNSAKPGGAVFVGTAVQASFKSCTLTGNKGSPGGGIFQSNPSPTTTLANTIVSGNTSSELACPSGTTGFASGGFNLIGTFATNAIVPLSTDRTSIKDPKLGPLRNNGGPTDTMMPLSGSPAIDKGSALALKLDQRGFPRTYNHPKYSGIEGGGGDNTDVGSVELGPMSYSEWTQLHFTREDFLNDRVAAELDPYSTGLTNSLKYFFNVDPGGGIQAKDLPALPKVERINDGGEYLTLTYRKNALILTGQEKILYSENFADWSDSIAGKPVQIGIDPATGDPIFRATVNVTGKDRAFLRLEWP